MWIKQDNELTFTASNIEALTEIPAGNWLLKFSPTKGFFLERTPSFKFPKKIYGDSEKIAERYLNTFKNQTSNLGILLTGLKGTGKSVTAKITCDRSNLPVILITEPFTGDGFKSFLSNITQETIVFIDEFEKVYYDTHLQNSFLSILDGIFEGKKIFLFTSNEKGRINQYMLNRPGRVHYLREYDALDESIINDVIEDNLKNKDNREGLIEVLNILSNVTMDMLISLIKEMNLYNETARESIRFLNLRPDNQNFKYEAFQDDLKIGSGNCGFHPLTVDTIHLEVYSSDLTKYKGGATNDKEIRAQLQHYSGAPAPEEEMTYQLEASISPEPVERFETAKIAKQLSVSNNGSSKKALSNGAHKASSGDAPSGWLYFNVSLKKSTISYEGKNIIVVDENGSKFVFKKETYYVFSF